MLKLNLFIAAAALVTQPVFAGSWSAELDQQALDVQSQNEITAQDAELQSDEFFAQFENATFRRHPGDHDHGGHAWRRWSCFAQNRRGRIFRAVGLNARMVQRQAMNKCYSVSRFCRPLGCRRGW